MLSFACEVDALSTRGRQLVVLLTTEPFTCVYSLSTMSLVCVYEIANWIWVKSVIEKLFNAPLPPPPNLD